MWSSSKTLVKCEIGAKYGHLTFQANNNQKIIFKTSKVIVNDQNIDILTKFANASNDDLKEKATVIVSGLKDRVDKLDVQIASLSSTVDGVNSINDNLQKVNKTLNAIFGTGSSAYTPSQINAALLLVEETRRNITAFKLKLETNECSSNPCKNGGTCLDLLDGFVCDCMKGWQGQTCESDVDECEYFLGTRDGCQNGAMCINTIGSYRCKCTADYRGVHCTDRHNDCDGASNEELCDHGTCVNLERKIPGQANYVCVCDQGWTTDGRNGSACNVDINECENSAPRCSKDPPVKCLNFAGGFSCENCPPGFTGNGFYCADVNECLTENGGCSQSPRVQCTNTFGSRVCGQCPKGFVGDGITCSQASICSQRNGGCHPLAKCVENDVGSDVFCTCPDNYTGSGYGPKGCSPKDSQPCPCVNGWCLILDNGGYNCSCYPGYTGDVCNVEINQCINDPCKNGATCIPIRNSFMCTCDVEWGGETCEERREACGGRFNQPTGSIKYPISQSDINKAHKCYWIIETTPGKVINLVFSAFSISPAGDCTTNYLVIRDGTSWKSPVLGNSYCGPLGRLPNSGTISTNRHSARIIFNTNSLQSTDGFRLTWSTKDHVCGGTLLSDSGTIQYPSVASSVDSRVDCYWIIKVSNMSNQISLYISQINLNLGTTDKCDSGSDSDFLKIYNGELESDNVLASYCSSMSTTQLFSTSSRILIYYHSNGKGNGNSLQISYNAVSKYKDCGGVFTQDKNVIRSPNFPLQYPVDMRCFYLITVSNGTGISLKFNVLDIEPHSTCGTDYVAVYDGSSEDSPLIGRYCSGVPSPIMSSTNTLFVKFVSDESFSRKGFEAIAETVCGGYFNSPSGILKSPNFPNNYPSHKECVYHIEVKAGNLIQLQFLEFELEMSTSTSKCYLDYVEVREGDNRNASLITRACGKVIPSVITSTYNELWIIFKTDETIQMKGFLANYTTLNIGCGGIFKTPLMSIRSPSHTAGVQCTWFLSAPPGYVVQLTFNTFNLAGMYGNCTLDTLEVHESDRSLLGKYCGNRKPPPITSFSNSLTITYERKESSSKSEGFSISYVFINSTIVCGGIITDSVGFIRSPMFPNNFPNNRNCEWIIKAARGQQISLEPQVFDLGDNCDSLFSYRLSTYLELRNGEYSDSPLIGQYCGSKIPSFILSHSNTLWLRFKSGTQAPSIGFEIKFSTTALGCGGTVTQPFGMLMSPDYPSPYNHNSVCQWIIHVSKGSTVNITVEDVDLEGDACNSNSLEFFDGNNDRSKLLKRICNSGFNSSITSSSNVILVKFRTEASITSRGFKLRYITNCTLTLKGHRGVIESPNFPSMPVSDHYCKWRIEAPAGNMIMFTFSHLSFTQKFGCYRSRVEIKDFLTTGAKQQFQSLKRVCGFGFTSIPQPFNSSSNVALVEYVTSFFRRYIRPSTSRGKRVPALRFPRPFLIPVKTLAPSLFRLEWQRVGCGGEFIGKQWGYFTSLSDPKLNNGADCLWRIQVPDGNYVELGFSEVDIDFNDCTKNYLKVFAGADMTSPLLTTICHKQSYPPTVSSRGNEMLVYYKSDGRGVGRGFMAHFSARKGDCGGRYDYLSSGRIVSRNYYTSYQYNNVYADDCIWYITVPENHVIQLTFDVFDLTNDTNCTHAYVKVYDSSYLTDDESKVLLYHCGKTLPATVRSTSNFMMIRLKYELTVGAEGFDVHYEAVCGGTKTVDKSYYSQYVISSSNYPHKSLTNQYCNWTLKAADPNDKIMLTFTRLQADESVNCTNYVEVREGDTGEGPLIGRYCGKRVPAQIASQGNAMHVYLHSNAIFRAVYTTSTSVCGGYFEADEGHFMTPGYPNNYPTNIECEWVISASEGNKVSFSFIDFQIEQNDYCNTDYVEIRESHGHGQLIGRFCGEEVPTMNLTSSNVLWIKFRSDGVGTAKGFYGFYALQHGVELTGDMGVITSPRYPDAYATGTGKFMWSITSSINTGIMVTFNNLQIVPSRKSKICKRYLQILNGIGEGALSVGKYCGFSNPEPVIIRSNVISVIYYSRKPGRFRITWKANTTLLIKSPSVGPKKIQCGEDYFLNASTSLNLTSPGYPYGYSQNLNCSWTLTTSVGFHFSLKVIDINIEGENCKFDKLQFYEPKEFEAQSWSLNETICGRSKRLLQSTSNRLRIDFLTDPVINKTGFNLNIKPLCGGVIYDTSGEVTASSSQNSTFCEWKIVVTEGRTIKVTFVYVNLPGGDGCRDAFVLLRNGESKYSPLLGSGKFCGRSTLESLETSSNNLFVQFVAPIDRRASFRLRFEQVSLNCGDNIELNEIKKFAEISSPPVPQLNMECDWIISSPANTVIRIDFETQLGTCNITQEYIEIRDGGTMTSPLVKKVCIPVPFHDSESLVSTNNMMFFRFVSLGNSFLSTFTAKVHINKCGGTLRSYSLTLTSPNYPNEYENKLNCEWRIQAVSEAYIVQISIDNLNVISKGINCSAGDYLEIRDNSKDGFLLGKYCSFNLTEPIFLKSSGPLMYVKFVSDETETANGFSITVTNYYSACGGVINPAVEGEITSPGFPASFPFRRTCQWILKAPLDRRIKLRFTRYNLKKSFQNPGECKDILIITKSPIPPRTRYASNMPCNYFIPPPVESITFGMSIFFTTSGLDVNEGFKAFYSTDNENLCGGLLSENNTDIISYGFNETTSNETFNCMWVLMTDDTLSSRTAAVLFDIFDVPKVDSSVNNKYWTGYDACLDGALVFGAGEGMYIYPSPGAVFCGNRTGTNFFYIMDTRRPESFVFLSMNYSFGNAGVKGRFIINDCGGLFNYLPVNVSTPGYPDGYAPNTVCQWTISTYAYNSRVKLTFSEFDVESNCENDYLLVKNGNYYNSPEIGKYCGSNKPTEIISSGYSLQLIFKTDGNGSAKGFNFKAEEITKACGGHRRYSYGSVVSPNYSSDYENNIECEWFIEVDPSYHLNFSFSGRFDIEMSRDCVNDYVLIEELLNGEWSAVGRFCGRNLVTGILTKSHKARVTFRTNERIQGNGFYLTYEIACGDIFTDNEGVITSPGYPDGYENNLKCEYLIQLKSSDFIQLEFEDFEIELESGACAADSVVIYKSNVTDNSLVPNLPDFKFGPYCGDSTTPNSLTPPPKLMNKGTFLIVFKSDMSVKKRGFKANYRRISCGGNITDLTGTIESPLDGTTYPKNMYCVWYITVPETNAIELRFLSMDLEMCYLCQCDRFSVYDYNETLLIGDFCGSKLPPTAKTSANQMVLIFKSNNYYQKTGFKAVYRATLGEKQGCGGLLQNSSGVIAFPRDSGGTYASDLDCVWIIMTDENTVVNISFDMLDIENSTKCSFDYLEIRDGNSHSDPLINYYCGNYVPDPVLSSGNKLFVQFHSDSETSKTGFKLRYEAVNSSCGGSWIVTNVTQSVKSPNYPSAYPPLSRCRYHFVLTKPWVQLVDFNFQDFDVSCENGDYIELVDEKIAMEPYRLCGTDRHRYTARNGVWMTFSSGISMVNNRGFLLNYVVKSCNQTYNTSSGYIVNHHYPYPTYLSGSTICTANITTSVGSKITLYFHQFEFFMKAKSCANAKMEIIEGFSDSSRSRILATICPGDPLPNPIFSSSNEVMIRLIPVYYKMYILYTSSDYPGCGGNITAINGTFTSPKYPDAYNENRECIWIVRSLGMHSLTLQFTSFELSSSVGCNTNFVELYDGMDVIAQNKVARYCGDCNKLLLQQDNPAEYRSEGNTLVLKMVTSANNTGTGFRATFITNNLGLTKRNKIVTSFIKPIRENIG
ncbi:cubilin-like protein [Leptotrombidium deliense]|uniref:Cubilin-like protein n=1 Tax=Leptotrombidium deliense TaxID=299467 RepID=A0A443ST17_9ACAR|nr:cubilin-like protein [Leptotrombidium deliense]